jgi:ssDNA-binding Zn-finger/Zn-ribbon topoisomerase 1
MVRITKCPVCSKINKIKHSHHKNFVCCSIKFPIGDYQINKIPQNNLKEPEYSTETLEIEEEHKNPLEEATLLEEDYDFKCAECGQLFNEQGNRNFFGGIKCPNCGLVNYGF